MTSADTHFDSNLQQIIDEIIEKRPELENDKESFLNFIYQKKKEALEIIKTAFGISSKKLSELNAVKYNLTRHLYERDDYLKEYAAEIVRALGHIRESALRKPSKKVRSV